MINREWQTVSVLTYPTGKDSYGQKRQGTPTSRNVEMVCKIQNQVNVANPKYVDLEMIGITKDSQITDSNKIQIGTNKYDVMYVIPSGKYYQILMKREK